MLKRLFQWSKRIVLVCWLLVLFLFGIGFAQKNPQPVSVNFVVWQTPEWSLGIVVCGVLVLGVFLGVVVMAPAAFWQRRIAKNLKLKNATLERQSDHPRLSKPIS